MIFAFNAAGVPQSMHRKDVALQSAISGQGTNNISRAAHTTANDV
jgi:hypothetical protein